MLSSTHLYMLSSGEQHSVAMNRPQAWDSHWLSLNSTGSGTLGIIKRVNKSMSAKHLEKCLMSSR